MKKRFGREMVWLTLPVVVLGGVGWWTTRGGKLPPVFQVSNPFDPGPMRLKWTRFQTVEIKPADAARGFDWATQTRVWPAGKWDVPKGWCYDGLMNRGVTRDFRVVYRRGNVWKKVSSGFSSLILMDDNHKILVDLKAVPREAQEVRLRGKFESIQWYRGVAPAGWKAPKNLRSAGLNRLLSVESKPFDVLIKGENEPMPAPVVSRGPTIEIVDAKWISDPSKQPVDFASEVLVLQLRRVGGLAWDNPPKLRGENLRLLEANGRELHLFQQTDGRKSTLDFWLDHPISFSRNRAHNDLFAVFATNQFQPKTGWINVKSPLGLSGEISDGEGWPQRFDVRVERISMKTEDFGATKN